MFQTKYNFLAQASDIKMESNGTHPCQEADAQVVITRFYMMTVIGTCIAICSIFNNVVLSYMFVARLKFRTSHLFYLTILAFVFFWFAKISKIWLLNERITVISFFISCKSSSRHNNSSMFYSDFLSECVCGLLWKRGGLCCLG